MTEGFLQRRDRSRAAAAYTRVGSAAAGNRQRSGAERKRRGDADEAAAQAGMLQAFTALKSTMMNAKIAGIPPTM